jgi:hypothetical protein
VPSPKQRAAWEVPLQWSYDLIRLPFRVLTFGAKETVIFLDESNTVYHLERLMGDVDLPYGFRVGSVGESVSRLGLAVNFYHDELGGNGRRFQLKTQATLEHNKRVSLGYVVPFSDGSEMGIGAGYRIRPTARFFGLGPRSQESDKTYFTQEFGWAGIQYIRAIGGGLSGDIDLVWSSVSARDTGNDDLRNLDSGPYPTLPVGFGDSSAGVEYALGLTHDTTDQTARPASGGIRRLKAGWFESSDVGGSHASLRAELQEFLPLWWDRTLALRGVIGWLESGDDTPHFARLLTNGDPDQLRGYRDHRFRDQGLLVLNAEYRYPVWAYRERLGTGVDGYIFLDSGQVFSDKVGPALRALEFNYGGGFRFVGARGFGARIELGHSREDLVFRISLEQIFQYSNDALYHGRQPLPLR